MGLGQTPATLVGTKFQLYPKICSTSSPKTHLPPCVMSILLVFEHSIDNGIYCRHACGRCRSWPPGADCQGAGSFALNACGNDPTYIRTNSSIYICLFDCLNILVLLQSRYDRLFPETFHRKFEVKFQLLSQLRLLTWL